MITQQTLSGHLLARNVRTNILSGGPGGNRTPVRNAFPKVSLRC